ncbi:MAG: Potassium channel beta chain, partial [uncultured Quadrisphaera sp.]
GLPLPRRQWPQDLRDHLRQLAHPRLAGRERRRDRVRARRAGRRHLHLRHRRRVRQRRRRDRAGRGAQGRAARVPGDLHQGVLPDRPRGEERRRALAQAHHGEHRRLAAAAADGLRRPLPGPPVRHRDAAGGDRAGLRRRRARRQGAVPRGQRVDRRADPGRAHHGHRPRGAADLQPAAVLDAVAGHRGRGGAHLPGPRRLADRLVADRPGRADREVRARAAAARGLARHRRQGRRPVHPALPARRGAHPRAGPAADRRRARPHAGPAGDRLGARQRQRRDRPGRCLAAGAGGLQRRRGGRRPGRRRAPPDRRGARRRRRARPGADRAGRTRAAPGL